MIMIKQILSRSNSNIQTCSCTIEGTASMKSRKESLESKIQDKIAPAKTSSHEDNDDDECELQTVAEIPDETENFRN